MNIFDLLFGTSAQYGQQSLKTPEQQQQLMQLMDMLGGQGGPMEGGLDYLTQILSGDEAAFKDFEAPLMRQFEQQTVPGIAEKFAGLGSGGAQSSSAFNQTIGQAGKELSENLGAMRSGLKSSALQQLQGLLGQTQQQQFQPTYQQGTYGMLPQLLGSLGQGAGSAASKYFLGG